MNSLLSKLILVVAAFSQVQVPVSGAYELKDLVEMKCLATEPPTTPKLDQQWVMSQDTWYYVHMSQLDIYHSLADAMDVPVNEVTDHDVYYRSCFTLLWSMKNPVAKLYAMGKPVPLEWTPFANGSFYWGTGSAPGGLATIPLTDNKSYIFVYACWTTGIASWGAMANTKTLSDEAVKEIHAYAKSLGFLEKHFTQVRFDTCDDSVIEAAEKKEKAAKKKKQNEKEAKGEL